MSDIIDRLSAAALDPMWADHAEVRKSTLAAAVNEIAQLRAEVARLEAELAKRDERIAAILKSRAESEAYLRSYIR